MGGRGEWGKVIAWEGWMVLGRVFNWEWEGGGGWVKVAAWKGGFGVVATGEVGLFWDM